VIANLMAIVAAKVDTTTAARIAKKATARVYLYNCLPNVAFKGHFDSAIDALKLYSTYYYC